jgi:hypothetical protein
MVRARCIWFFAAWVGFVSVAHAADVTLTWKGKTYKAAALPPDMPAAQQSAVKEIAPWAEKSGYRFDFDAQGRVLLVTPKERSRLADSLGVVAKAEAWFDKVLPAASSTKVAPASAPAAPTSPGAAPIPEDPEGAPRGTGAGAESSGGTSQTAWGSGSIEPDTATAVLVVTRSEEDYGKLADFLAVGHDYLSGWLVEAHKQTGFTLEEPLCGAYAENAAGQEEWNGDHELMNRVVQLLTLRRFSQQPNWVLQGVAWECEIASDGLVYCFPFRHEFVFAAEHGAWPSEVKRMMKEKSAVDLSELMTWRRGTWDAEKAKLAWGVVHHLIGQGAGRMSAALTEFREKRLTLDRRETGPETWERIPGYELPAEVQAKVLQGHFGPKVLEDAAGSMKAGRVTVIKDPIPAEKPGPGKKK